MEVNVIKSQIRTYKIIALLCIGITSFSVLGLITALSFRQEPVTILLPQNMTGSYQLSRTTASLNYMADVGAHVSGLYLNINPETSDWRIEQILQWVHPVHFADVVMKLREETRNIKEQLVDSHFSINSVEAYPDQNITVSDGVLTRWAGARQISKQSVRLVIRWERDDRGALLLTGTELIVREENLS